jgi:hypothetical protein
MENLDEENKRMAWQRALGPFRSIYKTPSDCDGEKYLHGALSTATTDNTALA